MQVVLGTLDEFFALLDESGGDTVIRGVPSSDFELLPTVGRVTHDWQPSLELELKLLELFRLRSLHYLRYKPKTDLEWMVVARHYGLRTRLLDWTINPAVALYFALERFPVDEGLSFCVYVEKKPNRRSFSGLSVEGSTESVFFEPPHLDRRISNQHAVVCHHAGDVTIPYDSDTLIKFIFTCGSDVVNRYLWAAGVRHSLILPSLDGLCRDINGAIENESAASLNLGGWKPVNWWSSGRTIGEVNKLIVEDRGLIANVMLDGGRRMVGCPVECSLPGVWIFAGRNSGSNTYTLWNHESRVCRSLSEQDSLIQQAKIPKEIIQKMYPHGRIPFRTKVKPESLRDE